MFRLQGDFFHWYPPKNSKCQSVSKFWHLELFRCASISWIGFVLYLLTPSLRNDFWIYKLSNIKTLDYDISVKLTNQPTSKYAQIYMMIKQRLSPSILRLHTKFHADWLTISEVMLVFQILIKIPFASGNKKRLKNS